MIGNLPGRSGWQSIGASPVLLPLQQNAVERAMGRQAVPVADRHARAVGLLDNEVLRRNVRNESLL